MPKETASHINQLVATNPDGADPKTQGDDHIRMIKQVLLTDFPNIAGAVTADHTELSYCDGVTSAIQTQLNTLNSSKAPLASPALTGVPTVPTAAADTNTTQAASTAFVLGQVGTASPAMNGVATVGASLRYSRQDHIHPTDTSRAPLASPALTGTPTVPTAAINTNTTQAASTAFVQNQIDASIPWANTVTGGRVRYATDAESRDSGNSWTALSPYALDQAYRGSNQGSGWQRLPGGRIEQWTYVALGDIADGTSGAITFPVTFSSSTLGFSLSCYDSSANGYFSVVVTAISTSSISYRINEYAGAAQNARLYLRVIGE